MKAHVDYVLGLADDALVSAQRMGWWISRAPQLEEDVALANIGLDQLGQARTLLAHAGRLEGNGRGEDDLAYFRDEREFRNVWLVERDQSDFGVAMARLLIFATWQSELYAALVASTDATLAAVAGKAVKEVAYHVDHAEELFGPVDGGLVEQGIAVDPAGLRSAVLTRVEAVLAEGTLTVPQARPVTGGGRRGLHTEQMGYLLAEMQHLTRSHPEATW